MWYNVHMKETYIFSRGVKYMESNNIILILQIYIYIIFAVLLFHGYAVVQLRTYEKQLNKKTIYWKKILRKSLSDNYRIGFILLYRLRISINLEAFRYAYRDIYEEDQRVVNIFVKNKKGFISIGRNLRLTDKKAFFAYFLSTCHMDKEEVYKPYLPLLREYLYEKRSVYVCENAALSFISFGDPETVCDLLGTLNSANIDYNDIVLGNHLLKYPGNKAVLARCMMKYYKTYKDNYKNVVLRFFKYSGIHIFDREFAKMLDNEVLNIPISVKCNMLRLISDVKSYKNEKVFLKIYEKYYMSSDWEPAAVAAKTLRGYNMDEAMHALIKGLKSKNWYIRFNSAESLAKNGIHPKYIAYVTSGNDRFAIEALISALASEKNGLG